jgi:8-oxo-dGTP pyrophosphatase MutT (NUDIX family)
LIRIFFQIEIAHWFYLDFYCDNGSSSSSGSSGSSSSSSSSGSSSSDDEDSGAERQSHHLVRQLNPQIAAANHQLKPCSIRAFAENIFRYCPFLMQHSNQVDDILNKWKVFKHAVPTNGAIVLDETMKYVLLVQGFWAKASWGFPKGKVFEEETEAKCAIREVLEETGYDIASQLVDDQYLQININDQTIRLYIITGVSKQTKFEPRTRREIKEVRWFPIDELPVHRKDLRSKQTLGYSPNSFFMVIPFVKALKQWISIKNGNCSGHIVNGSVVLSAKSNMKQHRHHHNSSSNNNGSSSQRPHSTTNHKRHDSMSQHGKHYNQHQAWVIGDF